MIAEKLETIIDVLNAGADPRKFYFYHGEEWYQNLKDLALDDKLEFDLRRKYMFLRYQNRKDIINGYGSTEGYLWSGEFNLVVRSKLNDPDYAFKYQTNIRKLYPLVDLIKSGFTSCSEYLVKSWEIVEIENVLDTNMDGLKVRFTIEETI